jgi:hypothetical protein
MLLYFIKEESFELFIFYSFFPFFKKETLLISCQFKFLYFSNVSISSLAIEFVTRLSESWGLKTRKSIEVIEAAL